MVSIVKGNLLDAKEKYIAHQLNCTSRYAKGIAQQLFTIFPYCDLYSSREHNDLPGHITVCGDGIKTRLVMSIFGQYYPGAPDNNSLLDSAKAREGYFWHCLMSIAKMADVESIALPDRVGCGLARGNWEHYQRMLENFEAIINEHQKVAVRLYRL
jgi:O-acetyl-ADP-ribose deacetylase (regulator of RNase III)